MWRTRMNGSAARVALLMVAGVGAGCVVSQGKTGQARTIGVGAMQPQLLPDHTRYNDPTASPVALPNQDVWNLSERVADRTYTPGERQDIVQMNLPPPLEQAVSQEMQRTLASVLAVVFGAPLNIGMFVRF